MELQAEVAGGGEGAEFTLERLAAVLVLMDLRRGRFWLRRWEKACVFFFWGGYKRVGIAVFSFFLQGQRCAVSVQGKGGCRVNAGVSL